MSLRRVIDFVKSHEKELILFNVPETDSVVTDIEDRFERQNVRIRTERTASGAPELAVLSNDDSVLAMEAIRTLRDGLIPQLDQQTETTSPPTVMFDTFLSHLKETTFTSHDREQLLYASREIEDRARRVGEGTIHAGFQRTTVMTGQQPIYADLADRGIEVHAYGIPDATPPDLGSGQVHAIESDELAKSWFVVFNGGPADTQKTALLAQETTPNSFFGIWTYDSQIVEEICTYLERVYISKTSKASSEQRNDPNS